MFGVEQILYIYLSFSCDRQLKKFVCSSFLSFCPLPQLPFAKSNLHKAFGRKHFEQVNLTMHFVFEFYHLKYPPVEYIS